MIKFFAVDHVPGADFELFHSIQDIQLGQGDPVNAVDLDRLADQNAVKPAATPGAAGGSAEFLAAFAETAADVVGQFAGEGPTANTSGIGLGNAEDIIDGARPLA